MVSVSANAEQHLEDPAVYVFEQDRYVCRMLLCPLLLFCRSCCCVGWRPFRAVCSRFASTSTELTHIPHQQREETSACHQCWTTPKVPSCAPLGMAARGDHFCCCCGAVTSTLIFTTAVALLRAVFLHLFYAAVFAVAASAAFAIIVAALPLYFHKNAFELSVANYVRLPPNYGISQANEDKHSSTAAALKTSIPSFTPLNSKARCDCCWYCCCPAVLSTAADFAALLLLL